MGGEGVCNCRPLAFLRPGWFTRAITKGSGWRGWPILPRRDRRVSIRLPGQECPGQFLGLPGEGSAGGAGEEAPRRPGHVGEADAEADGDRAARRERLAVEDVDPA